MTNKKRFPELREQAIALRRAGKSRTQIKAILGIGSNETLGKALRGEPPPEWTLRPRAKDDLHQKARELRAAGRTYDEIAAELGVSKGSISLWVRDLPGCLMPSPAVAMPRPQLPTSRRGGYAARQKGATWSKPQQRRSARSATMRSS